MRVRRCGRRTNIREPRVLAMLAAAIVFFVAMLTEIIWLDFILMAGYLVALVLFVVHQVRS